jgi:hypothetical protein
LAIFKRIEARLRELLVAFGIAFVVVIVL